MNPLRFLLSGPGLIGRKHAELLIKNPETELVAVVAPNHEHNVSFAKELGVPRFDTILLALGALKVDATIISSPNEFHFEQALACIENNIPVFIEKPLTDKLSTASELMQISEKRGTTILVGHHRTHSSLLGVARDFLSSEQFGTPVAVQGSALFFKPNDYFTAGPWRTRLGGGPILINMIHEIGILRFLFGEIESVMAHVSKARRQFEVEDTAAITMTFKNGALGTFLLSDTSASSKSWEMTAGENSAYPFFPEEDCYHFSGTMGSLDFPSMSYRTYSGTKDRSWWHPFKNGRLLVSRPDPLERQLQNFVDVIKGRARPLVSVRDGYLNMVVIEAIMRSARAHQEVAIAECFE